MRVTALPGTGTVAIPGEHPYRQAEVRKLVADHFAGTDVPPPSDPGAPVGEPSDARAW